MLTDTPTLTLREQFIRTADAFGAATKRARARVSTLVFNDGQRLTIIAGGGDLGTKQFERAMAWFSREWPEGVDWPEGVPRPDPLVEEPAE